MSPAALVLQPASMSGGAILGVEFPLGFETAYFACALSWDGLIKVISGQRVSTPAMRHGTPNVGDGGLLSNISVRQNLRTKNSFNRLSIPEPTNESSSGNSKFTSPLSGGQFLSVEFYNDVVASVISLLNPVSPFAIFWTVVAAIIDTFDRASRRAFAHISEKIRKHLPSFANSYAASTIVLIASRFWPGASRKNSIPNFIGFRIRHAMRGATHLLSSIDQELSYGI